MSITRTCALDGCEATFETYPADDQRHCSVSHGMLAGRPAYRDSDAALRTCARDGCEEPFRARTPGDPKRFCSRPCSAASRRQDTCGACGRADDWYVKSNGSRACRCRPRASWARKRQAERAQAPAPLPVEIPAAPPAEPRPVWRPSAPGWPSVEHSDAVTR